jgi:hypothetical protein
LHVACVVRAPSLDTVFQSAFVFRDLIVLRRTSQVFCRMSVNFGLSGVFPWVDCGREFLERKLQR